MQQVIAGVRKNSIAEELGLEKGDVLLSIDGKPVDDVLDYYYLCESSHLTLQIRTRQGQMAECEVDKEEDEDLGLSFEEQFMGRYRHCQNHCIFCFIDQLPKGMRPSLYFKDDDARLSFLDGNYITMTNMSEEDFSKVISYHMSPINISVHTTEPDLRVFMLRNPRAADLLPRLRQLCEAGIVMNGQIVLCKGVNDGEHLTRTLTDLEEFYPLMQSVSIVPVGLTKYREKLYPLQAFTPEDCRQVIEQVKPFREKYQQRYASHIVHVSDEFFITGDVPLPPAEAYDGYPQLENGVGMMRSFLDTNEERLAELRLENRKHLGQEQDPSVTENVTLVSAELAGPFIKRLCWQIEDIFPHLTVRVEIIHNDFFGDHITVSGLLTGQDIVKQLKGRDLGRCLLLPSNLLKAGENVFLDGMSLEELTQTLQIPVTIVQSTGENFVDRIIRTGR